MANPHFVITDTFYRSDDSRLLPKPIVIKYAIEQFASIDPNRRTVVRYLDAVIGQSSMRDKAYEYVDDLNGLGRSIRYPSKGSLNPGWTRHPLGIRGRNSDACKFLGYLLRSPAYEVLSNLSGPAQGLLEKALLTTTPDANKNHRTVVVRSLKESDADFFSIENKVRSLEEVITLYQAISVNNIAGLVRSISRLKQMHLREA